MAFWRRQSASVDEEGRGLGLPAGARHYRAFVGPPDKYDLVAAMQFNLLTHLGLREHHKLLDIGCGSLRAGRLFIPYLLAGKYYGLEPDRWLLNEGVNREIGRDLIKLKQPVFDHNEEFDLTVFGCQFDFILAQSIFSHASPGQISRCLKKAREVMHRESKFCATYVPGAACYHGSEWLYPECVTYTQARILQWTAEAGVSATPLQWPHPNQQVWLLITKPG
jgi:cyclopropane fatty-acyl-phospholipid synthase-like methyltransferase